MVAEMNHKGPGWPWQLVDTYHLLKHYRTLEPFVFSKQEHKDYMDALCLMTGTEIKTMMWNDVPVGSRMFFTFISFPDL